MSTMFLRTLRALEMALVAPSLGLISTFLLDRVVVSRLGLSSSPTLSSLTGLGEQLVPDMAAKAAHEFAPGSGSSGLNMNLNNMNQAKKTAENAANIVKHAAYETYLEPFRGEGLFLGLSLFVMVLAQITPMIRTNHYEVHKFIGKVVFPFIAAYEYELGKSLWRNHRSMSWSVYALYTLSLITVMMAYTVGADFIFVKREVNNHRASMLLMAAALAAPLVQRVASMTITGASWASWLMGSWTSSSSRRGFINWSAWSDLLSCALAFSTTYGLALYFGTGTEPYDADVARGKGPGSKDAKARMMEEEKKTSSTSTSTSTSTTSGGVSEPSVGGKHHGQQWEQAERQVEERVGVGAGGSVSGATSEAQGGALKHPGVLQMHEIKQE